MNTHLRTCAITNRIVRSLQQPCYFQFDAVGRHNRRFSIAVSGGWRCPVSKCLSTLTTLRTRFQMIKRRKTKIFTTRYAN